MSSPRTLLLVPSAGHPSLLTDGLAGARVPKAWFDYGDDYHYGAAVRAWRPNPKRRPRTDFRALCRGCGQWTPWDHPEAHEHKDDCPEVARVANLPAALVLRWDGIVEPIGLEHLKRALSIREGLDPSEGVRWCTYQDNSGLRWALSPGDGFRLYTGRGTDVSGQYVPSLPITDPAHALALVCAARGMGEVVAL